MRPRPRSRASNTVKFVPDAGHFIVDEEPGWVRDRLLAYLAEV